MTEKRSTPILLLIVLVLAAGLVGCSGDKKARQTAFGTIPSVTMDHTLTPETHELTSRVELAWSNSPVDTFFFLLNRNLIIEHVEVQGGTAGELQLLAEDSSIAGRLLPHTNDLLLAESGEHLALYALPVTGRSETVTLSFDYSGEIFDEVAVPEFSRWEIADETSGIISPKGAFLTPMTGYYPAPPGEASLSIFNTTVHYPADWKALVEGNIVSESEGQITFDSANRIDGSYLVAGPYTVTSVDADGIEIAMYSYPQSADLVERYLQFSSRYMAMYREMFGPYAFDRFSVVENWFPTGYGMPSYTLLGTDVLRLPFIVYTSLGHEICHNWWGNGVLVDYDTGNWCEGLTTYCADYHYKVQESADAARQYRMDLLRDYSDYVIRGDESDFPVREFTSRTTAGTRTIGYGKVMMIFHMMEQRIGEEAFWASLRQVYTDKMFQRASWTDFMETFAHSSGERLDWYERQWVDRAGAPQLVVENPTKSLRDDRIRTMIEFDIRQAQDAEPFVLDVPIRIHFASDSTKEHILRDVRGRMYHARVEVEGRPNRIEVDPDFHLFRVLDIREAPPTLSGFFAADKPLAVVPGGAEGAMYRTFAERFLSRSGVEIVSISEFKEEAFKDRAILFLGMSDRIVKAQTKMDEVGSELNARSVAVVAARRDVNNTSLVHLDVWGGSEAALMAIASRLSHYGKYSYLAFDAGRNIGKGQWSVDNSPMSIEFP